MKYLLKLAYKNIIRSKRRTILTFLMLSFGMFFYIFMASLMEGIDQKSFENMLNFETGHFKIQSPTFDEDRPFDFDNLLENSNQIKNKLSKHKFITATTERVLFMAEIDNSVDSTPIVVVGIDPINDPKIFALKDFIEKGKLKPNGGIIGADLAKGLGLKVGDFVYLTFRDFNGMTTAMEIEYSAKINSADPRINNSTVFVNINEAQKFLGTKKISEIFIKTTNHKKYKRFEKLLKLDMGKAKLLSWRAQADKKGALVASKKQSSYLFLFLIIVMAMVGIINTMLISVLEKRKEIGTLKALGFTDKQVQKLFILEGFFIGFFGSIIGIVIGFLGNLYFVIAGFDMAMYDIGETNTNVGFDVMGVIYPPMFMPDYITASVVVILASILASYIPAKKVLSMQPADCLRITQ